MTGAQAVYEVHEGSQALGAVRAAWEALEETGASHIFQTYAYADLWWRTVGEASGAKPIIITLREGDRVVGIFPVCRVREEGLPLLVWLGGPKTLDYGDILFDAGAARTPVDGFVGESLRLLKGRAGLAALYLLNVREDSRAIAALRSRLRTYKTSTAPYVPISGTWETYLESRGRSLRKSFNRKLRHLQARGDVRFTLTGCEDPATGTAVDCLVAFQRARFASTMARTNLFDDRYVALRRDRVTVESTGRMATLTLDGTCVAASLHALFRGRLYNLVTSFDSDYATESPGFLIHGLVIRACHENGWGPDDFCWGDEAHKYRWTDDEVSLTTFVGDDIKGVMLSVMGRARRGLERKLCAIRRRPQPAQGS